MFWGTSANAWGKWKFFHWPLARGRIWARIALAVGMLNVMPLLYFVMVMFLLHDTPKPDKLSDGLTIVCVAVSSIGPAFAILGFYRITIGVVHAKPKWFYYTDKKIKMAFSGMDVKAGEHHYIDPTVESLHLKGKEWAACPNLGWGAAYVLLASFCLLARVPIQ